ncbi:hypothetical protein CFP56_006140 [Quercus suber]|uniref:Transcription factor n=1 Tax=Quercus suber TaxID=58331 RepID=A0AAW0L8I3_QUESU
MKVVKEKRKASLAFPARRSFININKGGRTKCSKSKVVSDKLEALKSLIPASTDETVKPDQLFQETAEYIVLLKTQVNEKNEKLLYGTRRRL